MKVARLVVVRYYVHMDEMNINVGDRVTLKADDDEGWEEEHGVVLEVQERSSGTPIITVEIDEAERHDIHDDGLREVTPDQLG